MGHTGSYTYILPSDSYCYYRKIIINSHKIFFRLYDSVIIFIVMSGDQYDCI